MAMMDFIRKQFIDVIEWSGDDGRTVAWRFPMADGEIQTGAQLTVRDSQLAVFVDQGVIADVFGPGRHRLTTSTLPLLTNLRHWDKGFDSPFKSDVLFLSVRPQLDRRWGTPQPVVVRDADFGAVRLRAFGNFSWRVADAAAFYRQVVGARAVVRSDDLDDPIKAMLVQHLADAVATSGIPFLDLATRQNEFALQLADACRPDLTALGVALDTVTVQSLSLPDELNKLLDQRTGMGMAGPDMGRFMQYQAAQSLPQMAASGGSGTAGDAVGLGAGLAMGQLMAQQLQQAPAAATAAPAMAAVRPDEVPALLERLGELRDKGVLTADEFTAKKTELLRKLA